MTKEEAIKHLNTYSSTNGSGLTTQDQHEEAKKMAIKALETQLRWIPCSEEMPKKKGRYIVTVRNIFDNIEVRFRYWNADCKLWSGDQMDEVLAWCEIPEPWEGAQDEN